MFSAVFIAEKTRGNGFRWKFSGTLLAFTKRPDFIPAMLAAGTIEILTPEKEPQKKAGEITRWGFDSRRATLLTFSVKTKTPF